MAGLHAFILEIGDLLVHEVVAASGNTHLQLHSLEGLVLLQLSRRLVQLLYCFSFQLFDLILGDGGDQCLTNTLVGCPYNLKVVPHITQQLDIFTQILQFLEITRL